MDMGEKGGQDQRQIYKSVRYPKVERSEENVSSAWPACTYLQKEQWETGTGTQGWNSQKGLDPSLHKHNRIKGIAHL